MCPPMRGEELLLHSVKVDGDTAINHGNHVCLRNKVQDIARHRTVDTTEDNVAVQCMIVGQSLMH